MSSALSGEQTEPRRRGKIASFFLDDHRYVLLGTSAVALVGMLLSSQPRPEMSFLAKAFTVELVMYYLLAAWLVLSAVALVFKLTHWSNYAETAPFTKPAVRRVLRYIAYVVWAITLVLIVCVDVVARAIPKSVTFTFPSFDIIMFCGLISLWMI